MCIRDRPGADWCVPKGDWQARLDEYFRDTPRRVVEHTNGYKADMLRGIWAQAPYLHNGSIPTLGQLVCASTRPRRFLRGNLSLSLIHISEPTRLLSISYAVF